MQRHRNRIFKIPNQLLLVLFIQPPRLKDSYMILLLSQAVHWCSESGSVVSPFSIPLYPW